MSPAARVLLLCGGKGTRAYPHTAELPKPLLQVADRPVLQHVMEIYAEQGYTDFVLAAGFKAAMIDEFAHTLPRSWTVEVVDTGENTNTGGRVRACLGALGDTFLASYGDGLGDIDVDALVAFHEAHAGSATVTTVALPSPYGTIEHDEAGRVTRFREKPRLPEHRINAGFFVFDRAAIGAEGGEDLERDILPALGRAGELFAYAHPGFWRSMDTYKDSVELTALCANGQPPWTR